MGKNYKWAILGAGKIAAKFADSLRYTTNAELYAVASRSLSKATEFAHKWGAEKAYGSYLEMVQDETVDVIYVATPHVFHHEHSILCLRNKKAVLCEKPFAINLQQVEEMIATAKQENTFLMEAMWTMFLPHIKYIRELINSGEYGNIKKIKADFGFSAVFDTEGRLFNKNLGGGSLLDIGIYPVFLAYTFLGKPEQIKALANIGPTEVDEDCDVVFHFAEGVQAELGSSIIKDTPTAALLELEKATIKIHSPFHEPTSVEITTPEGTELKEFKAPSFGYQYEAMHVQEMLEQGRIESNQMTFATSIELIKLLDEIRKQIGLEY